MNAEQSEQDGGVSRKAILLVALATVTGMELFRTFFPALLYVLRDRLGWSAIEIGLLAFAVFLLGFLAAGLRRLLGDRLLLRLTAGGLGLMRLLLQLWTGDPVVTLILALLGTLCFWLFWPAIFAALGLGGKPAGGYRLALAILLGLLLDVALIGLFGTYERVWAGGMPALLLSLLIVALLWLFLYLFQASARTVAKPDLTRAWLWLGFGPYLALQLLILQNLSRLNVLSGWGLPAVLAWTLLANLLGLGLAANRGLRLVAALGALLAALTFAVIPWPTGWTAAWHLLLGQVFFAGALALIVAGMASGAARPGLARLTIAHGVTGLLLVALLFLYYAGYDLPLPTENSVLPAVAGALVATCALIGVWRLRLAAAAGAERQSDAPRPIVLSRRTLAPLALLLLIPAFQALSLSRSETTSAAGDGAPRLMTYNLHNGFGTAGRLDLEALAQVIEADGADVIGLQELSRGWVVNSPVDMLDWLARRLEMDYVFGPTADPLWGNAILSRLPLVAGEAIALPPDDLLLGRGYLRVLLDIGAAEPLTLINTHLHHIQTEEAGAIRQEQVQALLDGWAGAPRTVVTGDMNAEPTTAEMMMFSDAGFLEAVAESGFTPPFTNPADDPWQQIDYIWYTPDLQLGNVNIPASLASDHFAVGANAEVLATPGTTATLAATDTPAPTGTATAAARDLHRLLYLVHSFDPGGLSASPD